VDRTTFTKFLEEHVEKIVEIDNTKGVEYSGNEDVLSDFKEVAAAVGVTPEQALLTYMTKHWRAINSYAQTGAVRSEPIQGRIHDLILYGLLFIAMVEEKGEPGDQPGFAVGGIVRGRTIPGDGDCEQFIAKAHLSPEDAGNEGPQSQANWEGD